MRRAGLTFDVFSFSAAISACEKGGQWERALSLLDEMRERGVTPDVISFNAVISACEKAGKWERALWLLDEMRTRHGLAPTACTYHALMHLIEERQRPLPLPALNAS